MRRIAVLAVLLSALLGSARALEAQPGTLRGTAFDSLAGAPLAAATIQIAPVGDVASVRSATTDSLGRFRFDSLPSGKWIVAMYHPVAEALFGDIPPGLVVVPAGDSVTVALAIPGGASLRGVLCPGRPVGDSTAAIVGFVRDADADRLVDSATVSVAWTELEIARGARLVRRRVPGPVSAAGLFLFCGVPTDADLVLHASAPRMASGELPVTISPGAVVRRDIALGAASLDTAGLARGAAQLSGVVRDDRGRPLVHAHVVVPGAAASASTDDAGAFHIDSLPSGTWAVEARAIGYEPTRAAASLSQRRPTELRLQMAKHVAVLDRVVVRGQASRSTSMLSEFLKRQKSGSGTFITPADIEKRNPLQPTDLLWTVPGMHVEPSPNGIGARVRGRGGCTPAVYLDRVPIYQGADDVDQIVSAHDIMAVEVYRGLQAPAEFGSDRNSACGVVVLWTKR